MWLTKNAIKNMDDKKKINGESPAVVFKIDLHCEGCARNVVSSILHFEGLESVNVDMVGNKIVVMGKVDPARVKEGIENKATKKVEILSAPRQKVQSITVVLKIPLHCEGCILKIKGILSEFKG